MFDYIILIDYVNYDIAYIHCSISFLHLFYMHYVVPFLICIFSSIFLYFYFKL